LKDIQKVKNQALNTPMFVVFLPLNEFGSLSEQPEATSYWHPLENTSRPPKKKKNEENRRPNYKEESNR
jgi:hypothetical protein